MKIDAHQHFWKYNPDEYAWIGENMRVLKQDFLPSDLESELNSIGFDGSIAVQARQNLNETLWLLQLSEESEIIKGVVGWFDLCSPEIEQQLIEFYRFPKLVGVRHVIHDEADDNFIARSDFHCGISLLKKYNLTYDLLIFPKHLPLVNKLVQKFPDQKFVLDHIAKPDIKNQLKSPWEKDILALAKNQNVFCKLSGMVTEADWHKWQSLDFKFYLDVIFEAFGEDRLMIGSDWPVCTVTGNYKRVMGIVINYIGQFDLKIQSKILGENCANFYLQRFH